MKKIFRLTLVAALALPQAARAQFIMERTNLNSTNMGTSQLHFNQNGSQEAWSVTSTSTKTYNSALDISNINRIYIPQTDEERTLATYKAPTYADDYRSYNSWSSRNAWQLANVHDPTVVKAADGYYYMYQTDASYGNVHTASGGHFLGRRSKDLVNWEYVGSSMPSVPSWIKDKLNEIRAGQGLGKTDIDFSDESLFGFWAPCVRQVSDSLYRMYYAITLPGTITSSTSVGNPSFIGLMESTNPADSASWVDKGYVTTQYSDQGTNYANKSAWGGYYKWNAIDPTFIITPEGEHWLIYGSWHSGFAAVQLDPTTGKTLATQGLPWGASNQAAYGKQVFSRYLNNRWQASEGPEVVYHDGYYYMFMAFDQLAKCYNTRVVRSQSITGPYKDITGTTFTQGTAAGDVYPIVTHPYAFGTDHGWVGISHCAVFDDGAGNWYYASQQRFPQNYNGNAYSNAIMMGGVRRLLWTESGWPVVLPERYGNVPQAPITEQDIVGGWQNINLNYIKGSDDDTLSHQDKSVDFTLHADHSISGQAFSGLTWSLDTTKNILSIGSTQLYLAREADWEASPRHATIVYAGLSPSGKTTYWGKRVSAVDDTTSTATTVETVGATDNTDAFWASFSNYLTSDNSNCTFHFKFTNYTSQTDNWDNWILVLANGKERNASGYAENVVLRADKYGWGTCYNADSLYADYNWSTFKSDMDGATVDLTVTISNGTMNMKAITTTATGKQYTYGATLTGFPTTGIHNAFLTCEKSHLVISEESVTND
jgi:beta-xylosidase